MLLMMVLLSLDQYTYIMYTNMCKHIVTLVT
jgi:hypothetical protein